MTRRHLLALLPAALLLRPILAQHPDQSLSDAEVEKLRDLAPEPAERLLAFITFLNDRANAIAKLTEGKRKPGREEDLHDLMEQFASIADDLDDNLDDYAKRHRDLRKVLPRLITAIERWNSVLKSPPDNDAYTVARKLALESVEGVHESALKLIEEQKLYFQHPPTQSLLTTRGGAPRSCELRRSERYRGRGQLALTPPTQQIRTSKC